MSDAFAAAVRAAPDDDLPRLIYADYLDERGDPRGGFIRAQIELSRLDEDNPRRKELLAEEADMIAAHEDEWLGDLADQLDRWKFHRGFLEVSLNIRRFLEVDLSLDAATVAGVHLYPPSYMDPETVLKLTANPRAERVRSLYLGFEWVRDEVAIALAESPNLKHLVALDLGTNGLTDQGVVALAKSVNLPALRALMLSNNLITDTGAEVLADAPARSGLQQLDLTDNEITTSGASAIAASPHLGRLTELRLGGNRFDGRSRGGRALKRRFGAAVEWRR